MMFRAGLDACTVMAMSTSPTEEVWDVTGMDDGHFFFAIAFSTIELKCQICLINMADVVTYSKT